MPPIRCSVIIGPPVATVVMLHITSAGELVAADFANAPLGTLDNSTRTSSPIPTAASKRPTTTTMVRFFTLGKNRSHLLLPSKASRPWVSRTVPPVNVTPCVRDAREPLIRHDQPSPALLDRLRASLRVRDFNRLDEFLQPLGTVGAVRGNRAMPRDVVHEGLLLRRSTCPASVPERDRMRAPHFPALHRPASRSFSATMVVSLYFPLHKYGRGRLSSVHAIADDGRHA